MDFDHGEAHRTLALSVPAMDCATCVREVTAAVKDVEGVRDIEASAATGRLAVRHGAAVTPEVVTAAGLQADGETHGPRRDRRRDRGRRRRCRHRPVGGGPGRDEAA